MASLLRRSGAAPLLLAALLLPSCAPGSSSTATKPKQKAASAVRTDPAKLGKVTLTVWDQEVRGGQSAQIKTLNAQFQQKYPNITLKRVSRSFTDLKTTLKLALSGKTPPDVVQANNGRSDMGAFVQAGFLQPLNGYAKTYGWTSRYPQSVLSLASYTANGKTFGEGNLYGLPQAGEVVGVFYNKAKLTKLGVTPPKTWTEFEADLGKAKAAGEIPLQFGNLDKWPGIHLFGTIQGRYEDPAKIRNLAFGRPGASWDDTANSDAAKLAVSWADKGYLTAGFNGVGYDPAWQALGKGKGVFLIGGTWLLADLQKALGANLGFMLPPSAAGQGPTATGGTGLPFAITAKSKSPDAAAAYINFITSPAAMTSIARAGNLPVVDADKQQVSGAQADVIKAWDTVTSKDGLVPYLDYATPTMYDTVTAAIQNLLARKASPPQFLNTLQQDYGKFVKTNAG